MKLLLAIILIISIGIAEAAYVNDEAFGLGNSAYITVNTTTFDNLTCCDSNTLSFGINGSTTNFTAGTNKTLTSITLNNATDNFTVQASGIAGYLNFSVIMKNASSIYDFTANGAFVESKHTTAGKLVWFNYTGNYPTTLTVAWNTVVSSNLSVITNTGTSITTSGATLNGDFVSVSLPVTAYFEFTGSPSSYKYKTPNQNVGTNGAFSANVKGFPFISGRKYYYRAVANNGIDTAYGNQVEITMLSLTPISDYDFDHEFNNLTNASFDPQNMSQVAVFPYTNVLGTLFWGFLFGILFLMLWMRSEDVTIPALLGLIIGGSLWAFMPAEWVQMAASLTVISFAGLIYSLIKGRS